MDRSLHRFFKLERLERNDYAHFYGIRHYCGRLPRDAGFCAGPRSTLAIRDTDTAYSVQHGHSQHGHSEHTGRRQVVDLKELQPAVRSKVDDVVAQTSEEDLQSLRKSIDATPEAASALKAKGLSSLQVVAINIADGVLTLITKTA